MRARFRVPSAISCFCRLLWTRPTARPYRAQCSTSASTLVQAELGTGCISCEPVKNTLTCQRLRLTLLAHFENPLIGKEPEAEDLGDRCESGFERQVFGALTEAGYRVIPQVKTGAYFIDLVVEGAGDARLAVECDGDDFHGPDRWPQDMQRQRVLERAGWTFWRCFASTWRLSREEVFLNSGASSTLWASSH